MIDNQSVRMKRSFLTYLAYILFLVLFSHNLLNANWSSIQIMHLINLIGLIVLGVVLLRTLIKFNFLKINDGNIIIYRDFFINEFFLLSDVIEFNEPDHPFSKAYFLTKSGEKKGKFIPSNVNSDDLRRFKKYLSSKGIKVS